MYARKCGIDIAPAFREITELGLYCCSRTGYRFWRPQCVAGDEAFYKAVSTAWPNYYRTDRWEYDLARKYLTDQTSVLEIGCGPGHFLKSIETTVPEGLGIEFNSEAIASKVTKFPVIRTPIESLAQARPGEFRVALAFQVLEHVIDPFSFIQSALACLKPGGLLILSTPNHDHAIFRNQEDAFDLPPHHIGHFDAPTYEAIASMLGVEVLEIALQAGERAGGGVVRSLIGALAFARKAPGPNMLVVYRK